MLGQRLGTALTATALAALGPLVACGGHDDASGTTTTTETPQTTEALTTTLSPEEQTEAEVRAAYDAYSAMNERLASAPDPQDPEIAERTTGGARDALTTLLTGFIADDHVVRFEADSSYEVLSVELDGVTARLRDCRVDHASTLEADTGELIRESTATLHLDVTLVQQAGIWKVEHLERLGIWDGVVACE